MFGRLSGLLGRICLCDHLGSILVDQNNKNMQIVRNESLNVAC
jgi:hypothetical protein